MKVLIIEDDNVIATNLYDYLKNLGYVPDHAGSGTLGLRMAQAEHWDAILLDLSLPGMDGLTLCRKLRHEARSDTPVLMLTARDTLDDKLDGFAHGADDYLVKPFSLKEVHARLAALIKRSRGRVVPAHLRSGDLTLDPATLTVWRAGRQVKLPPKCLRLLQILMESPDRVHRHADLEAAVWGEALDTRTLRTHLHTLRRALTANGESDPIETVPGFGYKMAGEAASAA